MAAALLLLAGWGCGSTDKVTAPDAGPSGIADTTNVRLVAWVDSNTVGGYGYTRTVRLGVLDRTAANSFVVWRQEPSGGYRRIKDFLQAPALRFLSQGGEYYEFTDLIDPTAGPVVRYQAQGFISGVASSKAPLSNVAAVSSTLPSTAATVVVVAPKDSADADSVPELMWKHVDGAKGYVVQLYKRPTNYSNEDAFTESRFQLLYPKSHNFVVAYVPTPNGTLPGDSIRFQIRSAQPATYFEGHFDRMLAEDYYSWRVVAVDQNDFMSSGNPGFPRPFIYNNQIWIVPSGFEVYFAARP